MDQLSGEMTETNASFDGPDFDDASIETDDDSVKVNATGVLEGDTDLDRPFSGDKINFSLPVAVDRVAGRVAFRKPEITASGTVDSYYDENRPAPTALADFTLPAEAPAPCEPWTFDESYQHCEEHLGLPKIPACCGS